MYGYWPSSLFSNRGFIIWLSGQIFLRDTAGSPERARWSRLGSQSQRAVWFILPGHGAGYVLRRPVISLCYHYTSLY